MNQRAHHAPVRVDLRDEDVRPGLHRLPHLPDRLHLADRGDAARRRRGAQRLLDRATGVRAHRHAAACWSRRGCAHSRQATPYAAVSPTAGFGIASPRQAGFGDMEGPVRHPRQARARPLRWVPFRRRRADRRGDRQGRRGRFPALRRPRGLPALPALHPRQDHLRPLAMNRRHRACAVIGGEATARAIAAGGMLSVEHRARHLPSGGMRRRRDPHFRVTAAVACVSARGGDQRCGSEQQARSDALLSAAWSARRSRSRPARQHPYPDRRPAWCCTPTAPWSRTRGRSSGTPACAPPSTLLGGAPPRRGRAGRARVRA
jgi:hypothetical protein